MATGVPFKVTVADGRTAATSKRSSSTVLKPDYFKMDISGYTVPGESSVLLQLRGGNVIVK